VAQFSSEITSGLMFLDGVAISNWRHAIVAVIGAIVAIFHAPAGAHSRFDLLPVVLAHRVRLPGASAPAVRAACGGLLCSARLTTS
jgi:hypothetical protein